MALQHASCGIAATQFRMVEAVSWSIQSKGSGWTPGSPHSIGMTAGSSMPPKELGEITLNTSARQRSAGSLHTPVAGVESGVPVTSRYDEQDRVRILPGVLISGSPGRTRIAAVPLLRQLPQHVRQYPAIAVILHFLRRIYADGHREIRLRAIGGNGAHRGFLRTAA